MPGIPGTAADRLPLAMFAISSGQYVCIAMVVNMPAIRGDMPRPATLDAIVAKLPPGWASMGQMAWPTDIAFPGSPKSIPAWLSASMKLSSGLSASAGAAEDAAHAARAAPPPRAGRGGGWG